MEDISKKIPLSLRAFEGAYGEKENIPKKKNLSVRASEGRRVARVVKKGIYRYKYLEC